MVLTASEKERNLTFASGRCQALDRVSGTSTRVLLLASLSLVAGCAAKPTAPPAAPDGKPTGERRVTLVATAEIRGTPEPCGCQSDPLGDVARVVTLLRDAEKEGGALLVDAGGLRYSDQAISDEKRPQADLKAEFLEEAWKSAGALVALGPEDVRFGAATLPPGRRLASNVTGLPLATPTVREVGGSKIGVFGVLDPQAPLPAGVTVGDPVPAARAAVAQLRGAGATIVVALVHATRADTKRLVRAVPGITLAVVGEEVGEAGGAAEQVGETLVVQPADQAQRAARVTFVLDGAGRVATTLYGGADERRARLARIAARTADLDQQLRRFAADSAADPAFVAARRRERDELAAEKQRLEGAPLTPPAPPYAAATLVPVSHRIPRDPRLADEMKQLDARVGEANRAAGAARPVPAPAPGEPRYVGVEVCGDCHRHEASATFWKTTVHATAWKTLVDVNKQWSFDCIGCHVTGYGQRGGSAIAHVEGLTDVQCEVCHGPGSLHAAKPRQVKIPVAAPGKEVCVACHTPEHSDTFQLEAYLRDVLGPDHGARRRAALGAGPTGHELRQAAIAKARLAEAAVAPTTPSGQAR